MKEDAQIITADARIVTELTFKVPASAQYVLVVKIQSTTPIADDDARRQGSVIEPGQSLTVNVDFELEILNISQHAIGTWSGNV